MNLVRPAAAGGDLAWSLVLYFQRFHVEYEVTKSSVHFVPSGIRTRDRTGGRARQMPGDAKVATNYDPERDLVKQGNLQIHIISEMASAATLSVHRQLAICTTQVQSLTTEIETE